MSKDKNPQCPFIQRFAEDRKLARKVELQYSQRGSTSSQALLPRHLSSRLAHPEAGSRQSRSEVARGHLCRRGSNASEAHRKAIDAELLYRSLSSGSATE